MPIIPIEDSPGNTISNPRPNEPLSLSTFHNQLTRLFHKELWSIGELDDLVVFLERTLLNPQAINTISDNELLLRIYDVVARRRATTQQFILRIFEIAVRAKMVDRLLGIIGKEESRLPSESSTKTRELKQALGREIDSRKVTTHL